jgi:flagellar basal body-associated protein FliL
MKTGDELRRANLRILIAMIICALLLAISCYLWMHGVMTSREAAKRSSQRVPVLPRLAASSVRLLC